MSRFLEDQQHTWCIHEVIDDDLEVVAGLTAPAADATNNLVVTGTTQ